MVPKNPVSLSRFVNKLYFDPQSIISYSGFHSFYYKIRPFLPSHVTKQMVENILLSHPAYYENKPARKRFRRNNLHVQTPFQELQMDTADMTKLKTTNKNFGYLLCIVDAFSRFAAVVPVKSNKSENTAKAFQQYLTKYDLHKNVGSIFTDNGSEFKGKFKQMLKEEKVLFLN